MKNFSTAAISLLLAPVFLHALFNGVPAVAQSVPKLDTAFQPVITHSGGFVAAAANQADGRLIIAGAFNAINGTARNGIARLNSDGSVDTGFDPGAGECCGVASGNGQTTSPIAAVLVQRDGKIVIGGPFSMVGGVPRNGIARLDTNGKLDASFDVGSGLDLSKGAAGSASVVAIVEQPDGKLIIGGAFTSINGVPRSGVARLNSNGSVDTSFDPGAGVPIENGDVGFGRLNSLALLGNGQILVAGSFSVFNNVDRIAMARLNSNGSLDPGFDVYFRQQDGQPSVDGVVVQADGRIVVSGVFSVIQEEFRDNMARLNANGSNDPGFNPVIDVSNGESYSAIASQPDGKLIAFRQFLDAQGVSRRMIVRLNADGGLDGSLAASLGVGNGNRLRVFGAVRQADGKWVVVGDFSAGANNDHRGLVRIGAQGGLEETFNPQLELAEDFPANIQAFAVQRDGRIVIGGTFNRVNGIARNLLARLNADGTLDAAFAPVLQTEDAQSSVLAVELTEDGKIVIGGLFRAVNGVSRNGIARLNGDGTLDQSFDVGNGTNEKSLTGFDTVGRVWAVAVQKDGKVIVGGDFAAIRDVQAPWLARLNSNGTYDSSFQPSLRPCLNCATPEIRGIALLSDGHMMIHGIFNRVDIYAYHGIARLQADGVVDTKLAPPITADDEVRGVAVGPDDSVVAAVSVFDAASDSTRTRLLRFLPDGSVDTGFDPGALVGDDPAVAPVSAVAIDAGGRLVIAGQLSSVGGKPRRGLARFTAAGTLDDEFISNSSFARGVLGLARNSRPVVIGMEVQGDGSFFAAGSFGAVGDAARVGLVKFLADAPGSGPGSSRPIIRSFARESDGRSSMTISGEPGRGYRIETSTDLRGWTTIGNFTGAVTPQPFSDAAPKDLSHRFYRVRGD